MDNEHLAWLFLNQIPELGPVRFHRLLHTARSAGGILELSVTGLMAAEVTRDLAEAWHRAFRDPAQQRRLEVEVDHMSRGDCQIMTELDEGYPSLLRELSGRPPVLYYKGRWPLPVSRIVGIVGTRRNTGYGGSVTDRLASDLTHQGVVIVSGLARGIDTIAHQAALRSGGTTVAVLGCGIGQFYPPENKVLQRRIAEEGTLVSEFPFEMPPEAHHFPRRNRIISGLSQGIVVIEAGDKSGALITARYAAEQGRDVFAVPGSVFNSVSAGCHRLIKEGATLVETAAEILGELGLNPPAAPPAMVNSPEHFATLTPLEKTIIDLIAQDPLSADEISQGTAQRYEQVAQSLLSLELKGIVRALPGQRYARK